MYLPHLHRVVLFSEDDRGGSCGIYAHVDSIERRALVLSQLRTGPILYCPAMQIPNRLSSHRDGAFRNR